MGDFRLDRIAVAEQAGGLRHVALGQQATDAARRDDVGSLVAERLDQADAEAVPGAGRHQEIGIALPVLAEVQGDAGSGVADAQVRDEDVADEVLGAKAGEGAVEGLLDHRAEAERAEEPRPDGSGGDAEQRHVGPENRTRMRLEGQHQRGHAPAPGFCQRASEHGLVAAMHPVEIADRHHAAPERGGQRGRSGNALDGRGGHRYLRRGMTATGE